MANFHYKLNPVKGTIKLKPTLGTYLVTYVPMALFGAALWAAGTYAQRKEAEVELALILHEED